MRCHFIKGLTRVQLQFHTVRVPWRHYRQVYRDDIQELSAVVPHHRGLAVRRQNLILTDLHRQPRQFLIDPLAVIRNHWALLELTTCLEGLSVHRQGER